MNSSIKLGLRENLGQFSLLVLVNAFVGAMVGLERSILPILAEQEFQVSTRAAIFSFIIIFGISKAATNYLAGVLADRYGRKRILVLGWLIAAPFPFILMWAPSWNWILGANVLLGISQGLTWSTTVIMKIDLIGPKQRGLGMGLNEFAGYLAVAASAIATGWLASTYGLRPQPFYLGIGYVGVGLFLSLFIVRETQHHVTYELKNTKTDNQAFNLGQKDIFIRTSFTDKNLSSISQAGLVNNLNDGLVWGLFPLLYSAAGISLVQIGFLVALYPAVWGVLQLITGPISDKVGRKHLIVFGMWIQALALSITVLSTNFYGFCIGGVLLGLGTAMVYPTLLAAIGDISHPSWRSSAIGIYRLWRDSGYAVGAVLAGITADKFGLDTSVWVVAVITFISGYITLIRMSETGGRNGYRCFFKN
jgi:MFS family permease